MSATRYLLEARIAGEMKPSDIPVAKGVDLDAIKAGDDDPLEVVVEVPEGESTRGWYYTAEALQDIVNKVNSDTLSGFLGHQKPDNVPNEFPIPVTHWVGAKWKDGKAYFRGVIDKVAPDLKRWIRSKRVKQVSIFGAPTLQKVNGKTRVIGYNGMSIDWTPLDRAGMPTRIVAVGEMDSTFGDAPFDDVSGELDGSHEELRRLLHQAVQSKFGGDQAWVGIERVYDDHVIIVYEKNSTRRLFRVPYTVQGDSVVLGDGTEVELQVKREYVTTGEMKGDDEKMTLAEKLAAVRSAIAKGEIELTNVFGEMGVTKDMGVRALVGDELDKAKAGAEFGAKLAAALGFTKDMTADTALALAGEMAAICKTLGLVPGADVAAAKAKLDAFQEVWTALGFDKSTPDNPAQLAGEMAEVFTEQTTAAHTQLVDKVIGAKVAGEQAQGLIKRMLNVAPTATEEQISGEIDTLLKDEVIKGLIGNSFVDQPAGSGGTGSKEYTSTGGLRKKTVSI